MDQHWSCQLPGGANAFSSGQTLSVVSSVCILEHMNPCEKGASQVENPPTARDYELSEHLVDRIKEHVPSMIRVTGEDKIRMENEAKRMKAATPSCRGTYGGGLDSYALVANLLQLQIFCLDRSMPDKYRVWLGNAKGSCVKRALY